MPSMSRTHPGRSRGIRAPRAPRCPYASPPAAQPRTVRARRALCPHRGDPRMPAPRTVLLTGAAGGLGTLMRGLLPAYGYDLRLLDVAPVEGEPDAITADLGDRAALREAVRGVDAVIHLAGISLEASFDKILRSNIEGTY